MTQPPSDLQVLEVSGPETFSNPITVQLTPEDQERWGAGLGGQPNEPEAEVRARGLTVYTVTGPPTFSKPFTVQLTVDGAARWAAQIINPLPVKEEEGK